MYPPNNQHHIFFYLKTGWYGTYLTVGASTEAILRGASLRKIHEPLQARRVRWRELIHGKMFVIGRGDLIEGFRHGLQEGGREGMSGEMAIKHILLRIPQPLIHARHGDVFRILLQAYVQIQESGDDRGDEIGGGHRARAILLHRVGQ